MSDEIQTVELTEEIKSAEPEAKAPSREDLRAKGWSAKELDSAERRGMVAKPEERKLETKKEEPTPDTKVEEKKPDVVQPRNGSLPDFTFKTPEQEKVFLEAFGAGTPQRAMYFRMKNERQARQAAEQKARDLEARLAASEATKATTQAQETDEDGNVIDPEDKPLTLKQLREMQKQEAEIIERKNREMSERAAVVAEAQRDQEEYARSIYQDFDDTVKRAQEVIQNLDSVVPEKWKQAKAIKLIRELQMAAANADKIGLDDYNAALIAYEIGQLHPEYGKTNGAQADINGKSERPEKVNGGLTPEQLKRVEENTQRRASSASIPGGSGKRIVSPDDVTLADLNKMDATERLSFRQKHPAQYAKLLRG